MPPRARRARQLPGRREKAAEAGSQTGSGKGKDVFHFVSVDPVSESSKSENRSLIRSHASKYIWRQHRATRVVNAVAARKYSYPSETADATSHDRSSSRSAFEARGNPSSLPFHSLSPTLEGNAEFRETTEDDQQPLFLIAAENTQSKREHESNTINKPFDQLLSWLEDPFHVFPSMLDETAMSKLMRYAAFDLWPGLVPGAAGKGWTGNAAAENWMPRAMNNPALFTAFLYGAAGHMQTRKRLESAQVAPQTREEKLQQIICENETIKQLNKMMKDPSQVCSDEVILAVLCMAFNRTDYSTWGTADPYPKAPLRNLQWLDVYGGLTLNNHHIKGLFALIETKGGIEKMKMPGLSETLSVSAIMLSTKNLMKAKLPFVPIYEGTAFGETPGWLSLDPNNPAIPQLIFERLPTNDIPPAGLSEDLITTLRNMREYSTIVDLYSQGVLRNLELPVIADRRNYIQYNLVSLPPIYEFSDEFAEAHPNYEVCRLAAMVYSMLVIFPLPSTNRPFRKLAELMRNALVDAGLEQQPEGAEGGNNNDNKSNLSVYGILLWALMMGGIASRNAPDCDWFTAQLGDAVRQNGLTTWQEVKENLTSIMWMDCVCDFYGQALWRDLTL